jgi:hypothetical protein
MPARRFGLGLLAGCVLRCVASARRPPPFARAICYPARSPFSAFPPMIETNPIHARIADLKDRVASLRGYL